jgi:hypothetical protein
MALRSVSGNAGNYLKFSGRTGDWYWGGERIENPVFLADLKNLAEGWIYYPKGMRRERLFDPEGGWPPCPSSEHKQGMLVRVKMQGAITGVGDFTATAIGALKAFDRVHDQFMAEREKHKGKVPILAAAGKEPFGLAVAPMLRLQGWAERPADLPDKAPYKSDEVWDRDTVVDPTGVLDPDDEPF